MLLALRSLWETSGAATPTLPNAPGRVYKGVYPYFTPRRKPRPLDDDEEDELEELMVMLGLDI